MNHPLDYINQIAYTINEEVASHLDFQQVLQAHQSIPLLLQKYGVDLDSLSPLGSGDRGTAFSDGNLVVKITDDLTEATAAHKIAGMKMPGIAKILFAGSLAKGTGVKRPEGFPTDQPLYLIIQEKADTTLSNMEERIADSIGDFLSVNGKWPFDVKQMTRAIYNNIYQTKGQNLISPANTKMIEQVLSAVLGLYLKGGIKYFDVGAANIGKDQEGNFVIFDLGVSISKRTALPVVEWLAHNWQLPVVS